MKVIFTSKRSVSMLIFLIIGTIFLFFGYKLIRPVLYIIGSIICLGGLAKLTFLNKKNTPIADFVFDLIEGIFAIFIGVIVVKFYDYKYALFTCGIIYIIIPIIRIFMANNKINQLFVDSLKYLGVVVLLSCIFQDRVSGYVVALIFYGFAIFIFVTLLFKIRRLKRSDDLNEIKDQSKEE